jgi:hypothetical protein
VVTDNGAPVLSATNAFQVIVTEVNLAPVLVVPPDQTIREVLDTLVVTFRVIDPDEPANAFLFSLVSAPAGVQIDPHSGVLTWTPAEEQGPSTNVITVEVADSGSPPLSSQGSFQVVVTEVNTVPALVVPRNLQIDELSTLVVTNIVGDVDLPRNTITFSLESAPKGVLLDPETGVLTWTPSEEQGPSTNLITVKATDDGIPPFSDTHSFTVVVKEVNAPPVLAYIADQVVLMGSELVITNFATDTDLPANHLTFSLDPGAPPDVLIDPSTGRLTWIPDVGQGPSTNQIVVRVTDDGVPPLSDSRLFKVIVLAPPVIDSIFVSEEAVVLTWNAIEGRTYRVEFESDPSLSSWTALEGDITASGPTATKLDFSVPGAQRFYRLVLLP